jgi:hypothetical protein
MGNVDGEGPDDIILGANSEGPGGKAYVYSGNDLFLRADPPNPGVFQTLDLHTSAGPPSNLAGLFVVDVDGFPTFTPVQLGIFDLTGVWTVSGPVPAVLFGAVLTFRSLAVGGSGSLIDTADEVVSFQ